MKPPEELSLIKAATAAVLLPMVVNLLVLGTFLLGYH